jgi:hypothetical protein
MFMSMFADAQSLTQELQLSCGLVKKDAEKVFPVFHGSHGIENGGLGQQKHVELNKQHGNGSTNYPLVN